MIRPDRFVTDAARKWRLKDWRSAVGGNAKASAITTARTVAPMPGTDSMGRMALPPSANRILSTPCPDPVRIFLRSSLQAMILLTILPAVPPGTREKPKRSKGKQSSRRSRGNQWAIAAPWSARKRYGPDPRISMHGSGKHLRAASTGRNTRSADCPWPDKERFPRLGGVHARTICDLYANRNCPPPALRLSDRPQSRRIQWQSNRRCW